MTNLPKEIIDFNKLESEIAQLEVKKSRLAKEIIKKYCPYKVGMKIKYSEWWRKEVLKPGLIDRIYFEGIDEEAIDHKWKISVRPLTKDLKKPERVRYSINLGENEGDKIVEILSETEKATT